jgi:hypothetical protein
MWINALDIFGTYLKQLEGNTRLPEDEFKPEEREMFEGFLNHCRKTYAHNTVFMSILGPINQYVSRVLFNLSYHNEYYSVCSKNTAIGRHWLPIHFRASLAI